MCKNEYWTKMGIPPSPPPLQTESCSKSYESTDYRELHEGGLPNKGRYAASAKSRSDKMSH